MKIEYVWYLSYGSNLDKERFLTYIKGGKPNGSQKEERGCRNQTEPLKEKFIQISYPLYFAHYSKRWEGAPAFIGTEKDENEKTFAKMYLIATDQLEDVIAQENNRGEVNVDFLEVIEKGKMELFPSLYGTILYVGNYEKYPVFSFTSAEKIENVQFEKPSIPYLSMIANGLISSGELTKEEVIYYLLKKKGVKENYQYEELNEKI